MSAAPASSNSMPKPASRPALLDPVAASAGPAAGVAVRVGVGVGVDGAVEVGGTVGVTTNWASAEADRRCLSAARNALIG